MSNPNDNDQPQDSLPASPRSLTPDEAYAFYGLSSRQWHAIKRSVLRGSKKFWARRGQAEPDYSFSNQARADIAGQKAKLRALRRDAEKAGEVPDADTEPATTIDDEPSTL